MKSTCSPVIKGDGHDRVFARLEHCAAAYKALHLTLTVGDNLARELVAGSSTLQDDDAQVDTVTVRALPGSGQAYARA